MNTYFLKSLCLGLCGLFFAAQLGAADRPLIWPTPNTAFAQKASFDDYIQPTPGNAVTSGLFGGVRNNGYRFHEGLDMKAVKRDHRNRVTDVITVALDGKIAYINRIPGNSSYGNYVVLEHAINGLNLYTIYAHMATVDKNLSIGQVLPAGARLGIMGRTSGTYKMPDSQTHLHFEIGVQLSDCFQSWYDWRKLGGKNHHGNYSGLNLMGMDPLPLFEAARDGTFSTYQQHIANLPRAFAVRVYSAATPYIVRQNPSLLTGPIPPSVAAWDVEFTWYGFPKSFTARAPNEIPARPQGDIRVLGYSKEIIEANKSRTTLIFENGNIRNGKFLQEVLQLIFGLRK